MGVHLCVYYVYVVVVKDPTTTTEKTARDIPVRRTPVGCQQNDPGHATSAGLSVEDK